ncbi:MAG: hypothetical protein CMH16_06940 [Methylobacterium sp.]|nr:hypothetical protein [Methylobacterium sp.]
MLPLLLIIAVAVTVGSWFMSEPPYSKGQHSHGDRHGNHHWQDAAIMAGPLSDTEATQASTLFANTCAGCHGEKLEGGVGPSLVCVSSQYSTGKIAQIAQYGKGRKKPNPMPSGLATTEEAMLLARWLTTNQTLADSPCGRPAKETPLAPISTKKYG